VGGALNKGKGKSKINSSAPGRKKKAAALIFQGDTRDQCVKDSNARKQTSPFIEREETGYFHRGRETRDCLKGISRPSPTVLKRNDDLAKKEGSVFLTFASYTTKSRERVLFRGKKIPPLEGASRTKKKVDGRGVIERQESACILRRSRGRKKVVEGDVAKRKGPALLEG